MKTVYKRNGQARPFDANKIIVAINKAAVSAVGIELNTNDISHHITTSIVPMLPTDVESIQDNIETWLMAYQPAVAKAYIIYREQHREQRFLQERNNYIESYVDSQDSAASASEVDDNANVSNKNVATLGAEIYKSTNIKLSRLRIEKELRRLYGDDAPNYTADLESHVIYKADENSSPALMPYCVAVNMYPFFQHGTSTLDGLHTSAPANLSSFCGQFNNLIFLLSSQFQGAVAVGELFQAFTYYCVKEWGDDFYLRDNTVTSITQKGQKTISDIIEQCFQNIVYTINQPAGNRSYQSPFTNVSYFDKYYWEAMFGDFVFPDGSTVNYDQVNYIQKKFMKWFNAERKKCLLTFPVETVAMIHDGNDFLDQDWKDFTAEMYAEGHSFFTYISDNADSLSSCCFSGDTMTLTKSSNGVNFMSFKDLHESKYADCKRNFTIFHNGSWVKGKVVKLPKRPMYKITTSNNKQFVVSDNHLNPTLKGDVATALLTENDYLMFNTSVLGSFPEQDQHLTYEQGYLIGAFLGDGSFGARTDNGIYETTLSLNKEKVANGVAMLNEAVIALGAGRVWNHTVLDHNVVSLRLSSPKIVAFIQHWTNWQEGTLAPTKSLNMDCLLQSREFRQGIVAGLYGTDGGNSNRIYTTSSQLASRIEAVMTSVGYCSIIDLNDRTNEPVVIRGEEFNRNYPLYCVRWYDAKNKRSMGDVYKMKNNSIYFKIKSIEFVDSNDDIYCFEMANADEPYFTLPNGLITHNCRLRNAVKPEFSFTSGNVGIATGSKSVITINLNRFTQDVQQQEDLPKDIALWGADEVAVFEGQLRTLLDRIYKYHGAYNSILHRMVDANMLPVYNKGYISLDKQFLTIGINGANEAAMYLGVEVSDNADYEKFCKMVTETISRHNKDNSDKHLRFNTEFIPAESLGIKNYNWDKADGYWVPEDRNCYTSYFFLPDDPNVSLLEQFRLHGRRYTDTLDGGVALHANLEDHLSKAQYLKLLDVAIKEGTSYFTFNIPNSSCDKCGYISKSKITRCPKCHSESITWWTRIIGYLRPIKAFSAGRRIEAGKRIYNK